MRIDILFEFIGKCNSVGMTPSEKEIDAFLISCDAVKERDNFIKFCFYNWERRNDYKFMNKFIELV